MALFLRLFNDLPEESFEESFLLLPPTRISLLSNDLQRLFEKFIKSDLSQFAFLVLLDDDNPGFTSLGEIFLVGMFKSMVSLAVALMVFSAFVENCFVRNIDGWANE